VDYRSWPTVKASLAAGADDGRGYPSRADPGQLAGLKGPAKMGHSASAWGIEPLTAGGLIIVAQRKDYPRVHPALSLADRFECLLASEDLR
jgi:hypothetical protein